MPKVSVLISTFNAERFLIEALQSIYDQKFSDYEVLILDAGSTDGTIRIIKDFGKKVKIKLFIKKGYGLGKALNFLSRKANGEYLARMDADDISLPNRFMHQVDFLERNPRVSIVGGQIEFLVNQATIKRTPYPLSNKKISEYLHSGIFAIGHSQAMIRKSSFLKVGGYFFEDSGEDLDLFLRLGRVGDYANLSEVILYYRYVPNSLSNRKMTSNALRYKYTLHINKENVDELSYEHFVKKYYPIFSVRMIGLKLSIIGDYMYKKYLVHTSLNSMILAYLYLTLSAVLKLNRVYFRLKNR